tara:strand:+ start:2149 stop:2343 length:195 start_codon:yes stop_codon:yes gene_type:complete
MTEDNPNFTLGEMIRMARLDYLARDFATTKQKARLAFKRQPRIEDKKKWSDLKHHPRYKEFFDG